MAETTNAQPIVSDALFFFQSFMCSATSGYPDFSDVPFSRRTSYGHHDQILDQALRRSLDFSSDFGICFDPGILIFTTMSHTMTFVIKFNGECHGSFLEVLVLIFRNQLSCPKNAIFSKHSRNSISAMRLWRMSLKRCPQPFPPSPCPSGPEDS